MAAVEAAPIEEVAAPPSTETAPEIAPTTPESSPEGEPESEIDETRLELFRELFKGAKVDELRAALDEVPEDVRGELESEIERRVEQRTSTRQKEVDTAKTARRSAFEPLAAKRGDAQSWLARQVGKAKAGDFDALQNPDQLIAAIDDYYNGGIAHVSVENEKAIDQVFDKHLPNLTPEEQAALDKPLYDFGRTGEVSKVLPKLMELAIERAKSDAFAEGVKKGEASKQAKVALAEKLAKLSEIKQQSPGRVPNGRSQTASGNRAALLAEMKSIDPTTAEGYAEWQKRSEEFKRRVIGR